MRKNITRKGVIMNSQAKEMPASPEPYCEGKAAQIDLPKEQKSTKSPAPILTKRTGQQLRPSQPAILVQVHSDLRPDRVDPRPRLGSQPQRALMQEKPRAHQ